MDQVSEIIAESSIGQKEYVKYVTKSANEKNKCYMSFEADLSEVNIEIIEKSLAFMVKRHESLRTTFSVINGEIKQVIKSYDKDIFKLNCFELHNEKDFLYTLKDIYEKADSILSNLDQGPLVRFFLLKKNQSDYFFSFLIHHIICDAWSLRLIEQELFEIYTSYLKGEEPKLVPLKFQLKDYCNHQNLHLNENKMQLGNFWINRLKGFKNILKIEDLYKSYAIRHYDLLQAEAAGKFNTAEVLTEVLNKEESAMFFSKIVDHNFFGIKELAEQKHYSVSAILYTSFYLLIFIYARKKNILLAALIADRGKQENKYLIGCLLGGTYLPINIQEESIIDDLIEKVFSILLEGVQNVVYSHDFLGINEAELRVNCDMYVNYISSDEPLNIDESQLNSKEHKPDEGIHYAMNCLLNEYSDGVTIRWRYNKSLFAKELIEDMVECHEGIIDCLLKNDNCTLRDIASILKLENGIAEI
ncbi:condensation domain-containing protein [Pedobacter sp. WC2423]|uniref:condensation domain-containing protein n=1 Tax=Pedobacter sp. WC2423 TaxID=3234142 RepID=UPI003465956F